MYILSIFGPFFLIILTLLHIIVNYTVTFKEVFLCMFSTYLNVVYNIRLWQHCVCYLASNLFNSCVIFHVSLCCTVYLSFQIFMLFICILLFKIILKSMRFICMFLLKIILNICLRLNCIGREAEIKMNHGSYRP